MPKAFPLSWGGKAAVIMAGEVDIIMAAPVPCRKRKAIICPPVADTLHRKEPIMKTANPSSKMIFLPRRSDKRPMVRSRLATASRYEVGIHIEAA